MSRWEKVRIGDLLNRADRFEDRDDFTEYHFAGTYSYARGVFPGNRKLGSTFALPKIQRIQKNDFVYCKIMAWEGAFGIVPSEANNCVLSGAFVVYERDPDRLDPKFLGYIFKAPSLWRRIGGQSTGTNVRRQSLHPNQFENALINLPSLAEQKAIVARLDALADKVRQVNEHLDSIERDAEHLLALHFQKTIKSSPMRRMAEVAPLVRREVIIDPAASYTELGIRSFFRGTFQRRTMMGSDYSWQVLYQIKTGDLIFSNIMAWEQAIAIARQEDNNCVGNHRMLTCLVNAEFATSNFLWYYFTTPEGFSKIEAASPGTAARNKTLTAPVLMTVEVPVPTLAVQKTFDKLQTKIAELKAKHAAIREANRALVPAMLERIFKGG